MEVFCQKKLQIRFVFPISSYICSSSYGDFVPPTYLNTKRYARLVSVNVRNFRRQVSMMVRALCVGCYIYNFLQGFLTTYG